MSGSNRYVLDSNVFIEAKNRYYGFNLCPGFGDALSEENQRNRVCSIDKVRDELVVAKRPGVQPDLLSDWAKNPDRDAFFNATQDKGVVDAFRTAVAWANADVQFTAEANAEFARAADGWLVAYGKVYGLTVVTHEAYAPDAKKKVPIPNVCVEFGVDHVDTFEMLDDLRVKFILGSRGRVD